MITFYNCIRTEHKHGNIFCCKQHQASAHALHTRLSLSLSLTSTNLQFLSIPSETRTLLFTTFLSVSFFLPSSSGKHNVENVRRVPSKGNRVTADRAFPFHICPVIGQNSRVIAPPSPPQSLRLFMEAQILSAGPSLMFIVDMRCSSLSRSRA